MTEYAGGYELIKTILVFGPAYYCVLFPASFLIKAQLAPFIQAIEDNDDTGNHHWKMLAQ